MSRTVNLPNVTRRTILAGMGAAATLPMLGWQARAATGKIVAATFPGNTEDVFRKTLTPMLTAQGIGLTVAPAITTDQVGKMMASPGKPPYDALYVSPGDTAVLIDNKLIQKIDPSKIPNWSKLDPSFQTEWGPTVEIEVDGIAYNPSKVPKPKGYRDLFENPAYDKKISLIGFASNTALCAYVETNRALGGTASDLEPMFALLTKYLPKVGAIANTGQQQMSLYQQGDIDVFMASTGNVATLKARGVPCEFVVPDTGAIALPVYIHMSVGAQDPDAVYAYMNAAISNEAQKTFTEPPLAYFPTNKDIPLPPDVSAYMTKADVTKLVYVDWKAINANRAAWTERFNKIVANK